MALALSTLGLAASGVVLPSPAHALPNGEITCRVVFYYSSPQKTKQVGMIAHCPGGGHSGRKTPWFNVETFTVGHPNPQTGPQPGSLPCEFLESGCGNLPAPR